MEEKDLATTIIRCPMCNHAVVAHLTSEFILTGYQHKEEETPLYIHCGMCGYNGFDKKLDKKVKI